MSPALILILVRCDKLLRKVRGSLRCTLIVPILVTALSVHGTKSIVAIVSYAVYRVFRRSDLTFRVLWCGFAIPTVSVCQCVSFLAVSYHQNLFVALQTLFQFLRCFSDRLCLLYDCHFDIVWCIPVSRRYQPNFFITESHILLAPRCLAKLGQWALYSTARRYFGGTRTFFVPYAVDLLHRTPCWIKNDDISVPISVLIFKRYRTLLFAIIISCFKRIGSGPRSTHSTGEPVQWPLLLLSIVGMSAPTVSSPPWHFIFGSWYNASAARWHAPWLVHHQEVILQQVQSTTQQPSCTLCQIQNPLRRLVAGWND